jgi:hypothetical protein
VRIRGAVAELTRQPAGAPHDNVATRQQITIRRLIVEMRSVPGDRASSIYPMADPMRHFV